MLLLKWFIATVIFHWMTVKQDRTPEFGDIGASFAKIYGKMTINQMVSIVVLGVLFSLFGDFFIPFLIGIPVLFQIMAPFLAAHSIPGMLSPHDTEPMPTKD